LAADLSAIGIGFDPACGVSRYQLV
jgi:hypothetical protein